MAAHVQSVGRAVAILHLLAIEDTPTSLGHVAASLGLAKATTHGLLSTLREVGFVDQDPCSGGYSLGAGLLELGSRSLGAHEVRSGAFNWADRLAARSGEATLVGVFAAGRVLIAHHVFRPDGSEQHVQSGLTSPLHATAMGKVLLAHDPRAVRSLAAGELESFTYRTVRNRSRLLRDLAEVRDVGWAAAVDEQEPGQAGIAAPVRDRTGHVVAAVGIQGTVESLCDARHRPRADLVAHVVAAGRSISREFGHGQDQ